jgi:hypothetical protein
MRPPLFCFVSAFVPPLLNLGDDDGRANQQQNQNEKQGGNGVLHENLLLCKWDMDIQDEQDKNRRSSGAAFSLITPIIADFFDLRQSA